MRDAAIGEDVGDDHAVVAHHADLPERKRLADGEAKLGGQMLAGQRHVDTGVEQPIRGQRDRRGRDRPHLADRPGQRGDL